MQLTLKIVLILAAIYVAVVALAYLGQRRLMYFPSTERIPPSALGLAGVAEWVLDTADGERIIAWYAPAQPGRPTILYFHGNGGGLATRAERLRRYQSRGLGMLMVSYRGYSGSTGSPSEAANISDARLAYRTLIDRGVPPERIIVYGESLGTGVAAKLAAEHPVGGLILDAPYTSVADVAARQYPFLPVRLLLLDRYQTIDVIGAVKAPLLVVHGRLDRIIPYWMGQAVFAAASGPKQFASFAEAGHDDHWLHGSYEAIFAWIDRLFANSPPSGGKG
jgi:fermentation-respiration switch protein FrsA (DUF1100 family)